MRIRRFSVLFLLFASPLLSQSSHPVSMKGIVMGAGKPIAGALIVVHDYQQTNQDHVSSQWEARTEADGSFTFDTGPGCYDILVSANFEFLPRVQRLCLLANHLAALKVTLKKDPRPRLLLH